MLHFLSLKGMCFLLILLLGVLRIGYAGTTVNLHVCLVVFDKLQQKELPMSYIFKYMDQHWMQRYPSVADWSIPFPATTVPFFNTWSNSKYGTKAGFCTPRFTLENRCGGNCSSDSWVGFNIADPENTSRSLYFRMYLVGAGPTIQARGNLRLQNFSRNTLSAICEDIPGRLGCTEGQQNFGGRRYAVNSQSNYLVLIDPRT